MKNTKGICGRGYKKHDTKVHTESGTPTTKSSNCQKIQKSKS